MKVTSKPKKICEQGWDGTHGGLHRTQNSTNHFRSTYTKLMTKFVVHILFGF